MNEKKENPVGAVKDIKLTKEVARFCTGNVCDCCGKSLRFNLFQETLCKNVIKT